MDGAARTTKVWRSEVKRYVESPGRYAHYTRSTVMNIDMKTASKAWGAGNNAGKGFAPYGNVETVSGCIEGLKAQGWEHILESRTTSDVDVLRSPEGRVIAIGGDDRGGNAWAVEVMQ